jgi:hypothetical protein
MGVELNLNRSARRDSLTACGLCHFAPGEPNRQPGPTCRYWWWSRSGGKSTLFRPDQFHIKTGLVKYGLLAGAVRLTDEFEIGR